MNGLLQDFRHAARTLARAPVFAAVAIATLALGIGANTAIFSLVDAVLLRPLPYPEESRVVYIRETQPELDDAPAPAGDFVEWTAARSFSAVAASNYQVFTLTGGSIPERVLGARVSASVFSVLGIRPRAGRVFHATEEVPGADRSVIASETFWKTRLGSLAVGSRVRLDGREHVLVGVMPPQFDFPRAADLWVPLALTPEERADHGSHSFRVAARLAPGATIASAQSELDGIEARLRREHPATNAGHGARIVPIREELVGPLRRTLLVLLGAVTLVLLLACANLGNLILAKNAARTREMAIRSALGAGRPRLVRQLLTEAALLSLLGGAAGIALAAWGIEALASLRPWTVTASTTAHVDGRVLLFTLAASLATAVLFGLAPAIALSPRSLTAALQASGRTTSGSGRGRARAILAVGEVGIALALLIGAGLMIRSANRLSGVDPGFTAGNALTVELVFPETRYAEDDRRRAFVRTAIERIAAVPGIQAAGAANSAPLGDNSTTGDFRIEGRPDWAPGQGPLAQYIVATPGFFRALEIPVRGGRAFTDADSESGRPVALVNETMVRRFWPGENPIGRRIQVEWGADKAWREIVGVVGDVRGDRIDKAALPQLYIPFAQHPTPWAAVVLKASLPPERLLAPVRAAIWSLDRDMPVPSLVRLSQTISRSFARRKFSTVLLTIFGSVALLLATLGVYGVLSQLVAERRREIGIRLTLGAQRSDVFRLVARRGLGLTAAGILLGIAGAVIVTRSLGALLYEISPTDPLTFAALAVVMAGVSFLATAIPARRATRVDPIRTLRAD
ncbi:MAG: ABC transporter permease [Acidobacteriota bacterium]